MLNDAHFHVGQFYDIYTSPTDILHYMDAVNIERTAISSTTICDKNYGKALKEMNELVIIGDHRIVPVLWVTAAMLDSKELYRFLDSKIWWRAIKIHRQTGWSNHFEEQIAPCLSLARELNVPIIFHTGEDFNCNAGNFENIIKQNPQQQFILAHSKPIIETQRLLHQYSNVLCDTSFQLSNNITQLVKIGLENRILWGSDYPIPKYFYRNADMIQYYLKEYHKLKRRLNEACFTKICFNNFQTIWP